MFEKEACPITEEKVSDLLTLIDNYEERLFKKCFNKGGLPLAEEIFFKITDKFDYNLIPTHIPDYYEKGEPVIYVCISEGKHHFIVADSGRCEKKEVIEKYYKKLSDYLELLKRKLSF